MHVPIKESIAPVKDTVARVQKHVPGVLDNARSLWRDGREAIANLRPKPKRKSLFARTWPFAAAAAAGGAAVYFFDPASGTRRRTIARDRFVAVCRTGCERTRRLGGKVGSDVYGLSQKVRHLRRSSEAPASDAVLTARVMSEIFRDPDVPRGRININAENGVVILRGQADDEAQIRDLEEATRKIPGVRDVQNLLHLPESALR